jgi:hypothetical protein
MYNLAMPSLFVQQSQYVAYELCQQNGSPAAKVILSV